MLLPFLNTISLQATATAVTAAASPITPGLLFGALGGLATFVSLIVFARNDGRREGKMAAMSTEVYQRLEGFGKTLERVNEALDAHQEDKLELAGWRARTDGRMERAEGDILRTRDHYHNDVSPRVQRLLGIESRVEHLEGEDRRKRDTDRRGEGKQ